MLGRVEARPSRIWLSPGSLALTGRNLTESPSRVNFLDSLPYHRLRPYIALYALLLSLFTVPHSFSRGGPGELATGIGFPIGPSSQAESRTRSALPQHHYYDTTFCRYKTS